LMMQWMSGVNISERVFVSNNEILGI